MRSDNVFFEKRKVENFLSVVVCTAGQMFAPIVDGKKVAEIRKALT